MLQKPKSVKLALSFLTLANNESTITHRYAESIGTFLNTILFPKKVSTEKHICVVSQTLLKPSRDDGIPETSVKQSYENGVLIFGGKGVEASTLVVNTNNETELREQFEKWNAETVSKMDNHQKIAFHLVMAESEEPENGEDLFREIFNDVKLVTLSSFTSGIISTLSSDNTFERGSIYAIIGFEHNANELCSMLKIRSWPKFKISLAHFFENFELFSSVAFQAAYFD